MPFDIGILGGGQLAKMSIQVAERMGFRCVSIDPEINTPAGMVAPSIQGRLNDPEALARMIEQCIVVGLENEFVPVDALRRAFEMAGRPVESLTPTLDALALIQDKLLQKKALTEAGIPTTNAVMIDGDGAAAVAQIGFPMILKARFGGYDGRGTRLALTASDLEDHRSVWQDGGWLAEQQVNFKRELAVMVFVGRSGMGCFPTVETLQTNHVCDLVFPSDADASKIAMDAVRVFQSRGLFGVELFEMEDGSILVNEIAPRPHNSGHFSLDWGGPSQFDQYIRSILGVPFAPLDGIPTAMANLVGQPNTGPYHKGLMAALAHDPGVSVHWYGKAESRPGRKMGHINATGKNALERVKAAREAFYQGWTQAPPPEVRNADD